VRGQGQFEGRSSVRSWLYRIATHVCLDVVGSRRRRGPSNGPSAPAATGAVGFELPETTWLQPAPDHRGDRGRRRIRPRWRWLVPPFVWRSSRAAAPATAAAGGADILRDVLGWPATEGGGAPRHLGHGRAQRPGPGEGDASRPAAVGPDAGAAVLDHEHLDLLDRYVDAFERYDVDALVALLHEDATLVYAADALLDQWSYRHEGLVARRRVGVPRQPPGRHGGQTACPAFGPLPPVTSGGHEPFGIVLLETSETRITVIHTFIDAQLVPLFGLPAEISC